MLIDTVSHCRHIIRRLLPPPMEYFQLNTSPSLMMMLAQFLMPYIRADTIRRRRYAAASSEKLRRHT